MTGRGRLIDEGETQQHKSQALPGRGEVDSSPVLSADIVAQMPGRRRSSVNIPDMTAVKDAPLGYLLYRVTAVLRPEVSAALSPLRLTLPEFVCLRSLSLTPGSSSAELARHASVTPQAMNTVLRKLEDLGVVARPVSVSSGRALPAALTSQGEELLQRAEAAVRAADARILARLTEPQQHEFKSMLEKLGSD